MTTTNDWISEVRKEFPGLRSAKNWILCDSPGGTQAHQDVIQAVSEKMSSPGANLGGCYPSALETIQGTARARETLAAFFNCEPREVVFGANMTSITCHVSRSVARLLTPRDNIIVTDLDHDANVTPWVTVAGERGAEIRTMHFMKETCSHNLETLETLVDTNTKLVALGAAANSCGSLTDIKTAVSIIKRASGGGALVYVDAVHLAPHQLMDVRELGCDFLVCSAYKFCGPHYGALYGRASVLQKLEPHKLAACTDLLPCPASNQSNRWETGTLSFEAVAGFQAAVEYLASIGVRSGLALSSDSLRCRLEAGYQAIGEHEAEISRRFLYEASTIPGLTVHGVTSVEAVHKRTPTFCLSLAGLSAPELTRRLVTRGVAAGAGHFYALQFPERMGLIEAGGFTRVGFFHYNTIQEVGTVLRVLMEISAELVQ